MPPRVGPRRIPCARIHMPKPSATVGKGRGLHRIHAAQLVVLYHLLRDVLEHLLGRCVHAVQNLVLCSPLGVELLELPLESLPPALLTRIVEELARHPHNADRDGRCVVLEPQCREQTRVNELSGEGQHLCALLGQVLPHEVFEFENDVRGLVLLVVFARHVLEQKSHLVESDGRLDDHVELDVLQQQPLVRQYGVPEEALLIHVQRVPPPHGMVVRLHDIVDLLRIVLDLAGQEKAPDSDEAPLEVARVPPLLRKEGLPVFQRPAPRPVVVEAVASVEAAEEHARTRQGGLVHVEALANIPYELAHLDADVGHLRWRQVVDVHRHALYHPFVVQPLLPRARIKP
mmetsp:Transcript_39088/g.96207  ORF Transcript_39088/g.96207 Transcript_39088/m.96207 type:complete len:345 (-) Transcript_39088:106-1140(-)